jgi:uncharacterized repeat protein (TIGR01451 family)
MLHGWLTLQSAAREGGRYAITGQFDESCLAASPACPDARVFSIKQRVVKSSTGLAIDRKAGYEDPRYMRVEVSGINEDNAWRTDYPGEAGRPVMVRAIYHMPVVTPLLRPIAKSIRLVGQVVMNNENYAQVNNTRSDIDLADLPPPPPAAIPVADLQIEKSASPHVALVDDTIEYKMRISNHGPDEARGVVVVDELPTGITFLSATPADICNQANLVVTCDLPNLPRGVFYDVYVTVRAPAEPPPAPGEVINRVSVSGREMDDDMSNNDDTASTLVVISDTVTDLEVASVDDLPDPVVINQSVTYNILVRNNGISLATGVKLTNQLPEGLVYESATVPAGGGCSEVGGAVICQLDDLATGESTSVSINATAPSSPTTVTYWASVAGDQVDPDERNNSNSETTTISPEWSDVYVAKSDSPDPALATEEVTYSIVVGNNGPSAASGVMVEDTLPPGVRFSSENPSQGSCDVIEQNVICDLDTIASGESATISIVVIPEQDGTLTNRVEISSDQTDPNPGNDSATAVTTIMPATDLALAMTASPPTPPGVRAGELLTYRLVVTNEGPLPATNVVVEDDFPVDASLLSMSSTQGNCGKDADKIICNVGNLATGDSATIMLEVIPEQEGVLVNTATVYGNEADTNRPNNTVQDTTTVHAAITAFITLDPVCGDPGSPVTIKGFNWPSDGNKDIQLYWNAIGVGNLLGTVFDNGNTWSLDLQIPVNAIQGAHTFIADRAGDTAEAVYTVPCPAPNLKTTQPILLNTEPLAEDDAVNFQVEISNDGELDSVNQFFVGLYFDPPLPEGSGVTHIPQNYRSELVAISWLASGKSITVTITAEDGFGSPGLHDVYVVVDSDPGPEGLIDEVSETDNVSQLLQVEVETGPAPTPTPGPTLTPTPQVNEPGSLIGQAFLSPSGGQPLPQAGVEVRVYDIGSGSLDGRTFTDGVGSYFLSDFDAGTKIVSACIIIDSKQYTYTATGVEIYPGQITFEDLYLDEGLCN